ncbi:MAG TPA: arylsulfotransferase family protein, partial [Solirubrobacteraceae bacterium]|nr:arylsulfotransferase family protein [Solirubrobacteraceae bacterium]
LDGTMTVFDNGATPAVEKRSRALILDVDEDSMTATMLNEYTHRDILAGSQGSVQLLPNGNVFVGWGEVPRVSEFDHAGRIVFDAELGHKYECYRAFRLPWTGLPAEQPALALAGAGRRLTAYASWNGATEVRDWQLLAGSDRGALVPVTRTPAHGFETALRAPAVGRHFAAQALDRWGNTLGRSPVLTV